MWTTRVPVAVTACSTNPRAPGTGSPNSANRYFAKSIVRRKRCGTQIHFCSPLTDVDGVPETMLIVLRAGVFSRSTVRPWIHVLPETQSGALARAVAAERALRNHLTTPTEKE